MNGLLALALLIVAMLLLIAEVFLPSGGVLAVSMAGILVASIYYAYKAWWISSPTFFVLYTLSLFAIVPATIIYAMYLLPRTRFGKRILQEAPTQEEVTPFQSEQHALEELIGLEGLTVSQLSPGGIVTVKGVRYHAFTESLWIDPQSPIVVERVSGVRLVVRPFMASDRKKKELSDEAKPALSVEMAGNSEENPDLEEKESRSLDLDFET